MGKEEIEELIREEIDQLEKTIAFQEEKIIKAMREEKLERIQRINNFNEVVKINRGQVIKLYEILGGIK